MSELVQRLRGKSLTVNLVNEAADRIEALEAAIRNCSHRCKGLLGKILRIQSRARTGDGQMNKSELEHVWHSVTSVLENEFRTRGWLPPQAGRIEALEFEVEHERFNVEKTAKEAAKRIKALEAALRDTYTELKFCSAQLASAGWQSSNGGSVSRALDKARAALAPEPEK